MVANGYESEKLKAESYAEFDYRPAACGKSYRMVVVRKDIDVTNGQHLFFDTKKWFFYITNESADEVSPREVIAGARAQRSTGRGREPWSGPVVDVELRATL